MTTLEPETKMVGPHEFRFISPDRVQFFLRGEFDLPHAEPYLDFIYACGEKAGGFLYSAYDLSNFKRITAGARERVIYVDRPYPYAALALIGTNMTTRALTTMLFTAGKRLKPKHFGFPYKFVDSIDQANAWFAELKSEG